MSGAKILVVDDEPQILRFLRPALTAAGYVVIEAQTGAEALQKAVTQSPDLVILDLGLPDMDGKDVIMRLRAFCTLPILILSARDREHEKIAALDLGADDYIEKPFGIGELAARMRTALRHSRKDDILSETIKAADLTIDLAGRRVFRQGQAIKLTPKEYELLVALARNVGKVVTHATLLKSVWGPAHCEDTQYLRIFIRQLRSKIERDAAHPAVISTVPGIGYRFE